MVVVVNECTVIHFTHCFLIFSKRHKFTPPYGSPTNLRVSSTLKTKDVVSMLLAKFKVHQYIGQECIKTGD